YLKQADGSWQASWLSEDHPNKSVTSEQIQAVASYIGQDIQIVESSQEPTTDVAEVESVPDRSGPGNQIVLVTTEDGVSTPRKAGALDEGVRFSPLTQQFVAHGEISQIPPSTVAKRDVGSVVVSADGTPQF